MINKNHLEANLVKVFFNCCSKKKYTDTIQKSMFRKYGYPIGQTNRYLMGMNPITQASEQELFWFADVLNSLSNELNLIDISIEPTDYFTDEELILYKDTSFTQQIQQSYPIILDNLLQVNNDQWVCVRDVNYLKYLYDKNLIQCPTLFQPNAWLEISEGVNTHSVPLDKNLVRNIVQSLHDDSFITKSITLNLNLNNPTIEFDYSNGRLVLKKGKFNVVDFDTAHTLVALMRMYKFKDDIDLKFVLNITSFTEEKAIRFFFQKNSNAKIDKRYLRPLDTNAYPNVIINKLNNEDDSCLKGKIGSKSGNIVNNVQLFNLIDYLYGLEDDKEAEMLAFKLKYLFNKIVYKRYTIDFFVLTVIIKCSTLDINMIDCVEMIENIILQRDKINESRFSSGKVKKNIFTEIESLL